MTCLSCRSLIVFDGSDCRTFFCGHDAMSELDSHKAAPEIVAYEWGSGCALPVLIERPDWCPLKVTPEQKERQRELFDV